MTSTAARITLLEYARRIREGGGCCFIDEPAYRCEASMLETYRWIRCTRLEPGRAGKPAIYRVALTRLGVREVAAIESDLGRPWKPTSQAT